jgi:hypothetical protein
MIEQSGNEIAALVSLGRELRRVAEEHHPVRRLRVPRTPRGKLALALASALALVGCSLTPAGHTVTGEIADLVGIGDPSSIHELNLRDPRLSIAGPARADRPIGPVVVAASGTVPGTAGSTFEIVAWAARANPPEHSKAAAIPKGAGTRKHTRKALMETARTQSARRAAEIAEGRAAATQSAGSTTSRDQTNGKLVSCLGIVFPDLGKQETGKWCAGPSGDHVLPPVHVFGIGDSDHRFGAHRPYSVIGATEADVTRVGLTYRDASGSRVSAPVTLGRLDDRLLQETGATKPYGFFVAFLPYDGAPRTDYSLPRSGELKSTVVKAFDGQGRELGVTHPGSFYTKALRDKRRADRTRRCFKRLRGRQAPARAYARSCR